MNHPVLLPKRKEYGFLKPPSADSYSPVVLRKTNTFRTSRSNTTARTANTQCIKHFDQTHRHNTRITTPDNNHYDISCLPQHSAYASFLIDPLKLKYELKNNQLNRGVLSFGRSKTCNVTNHNVNNNFHLSPFPKKRSFNNSSIYRQAKNDLRKALTDRQAYSTENGGTNFQNASRQHRYVSIPSHRFNSSNYDVIGPDITGSDTGFAASRILVAKREKTTITNCTKCGKLYYDLKCLNCYYGKRKFQFDWHPINTRDEYVARDNKTKISGNFSKSTSAIDRLINSSLLNKQFLRTPGIKTNNINDNNKNDSDELRLAGVTKSSSEKNLSDNSKFAQFDKSFKFDVEADMKAKEIPEPPKLTLYLL